MRTRPFSTGPPCPKKVDTVGRQTPTASKSRRRQPTPSEIQHFGRFRQVTFARAVFARLDLALTPSDWQQPGTLVQQNRNNQGPDGCGVYTSWTEFSRSLGLATKNVNRSTILP
jgi:hypothetical protein